MEELVPIFICVVLPIAIVLIMSATKMNSDNKRAQILIKAIESNNTIDTDKLTEAMQKAKRTPLEVLNLRLLRGCIFSFCGLVLCIISIINLCIDINFEIDPLATLIFGGCALAVGASYLVTYFITRNQVKE